MAPCRQTAVLLTILGFVGLSTPLILENHLQPNRVTLKEFQDPEWNQCARKCDNEPSKTCYYKWEVEAYVTMGPQCGNCPQNSSDCFLPQCVAANGYEKSILTINRMVPGPSIQVCLYDRIIVDVTNNIPGAETSIHWHGVFQKGTQYMDGVPMLTQCAIKEGETFRYDFVAQNEGTHYWHSHAGIQKLDGMQGSLIIRTPDDGKKIYDEDQPDHVLMIIDWTNTTAVDRFPGLSRREPGQLPHSFLLNGLGPSKVVPEPQDASQVPFKEIRVQYGKKYRFRFIGALCTVCGVELSIQDHDMTLIATDGAPVKPVTVGAMQIFSGERYDMVINANQAVGTYWIHMRGLAECANDDVQIYQLAVLRYEGANEDPKDPPGYKANFTKGKVLNPENATCDDNQGVCVTQLEGLVPDKDNILSAKPRINLVLTFGFKYFNLTNGFFNTGRYDRYFVAPNRQLLTSWMNKISFKQPPVPLLSQREDIQGDLLCPSEGTAMPQCPAKDVGEDYCECIHVIKIPLDEIVQILLTDSSPAADLHHPFHLHGYHFYTIAMDQFKNDETPESVNKALVENNFNRYKVPAYKDTIAVPSNGYAVIRFKADNPGVWFFHCHFMYHVATGMAVVLQVGETNDWPPIPENFPKCGNYEPSKNVKQYCNMLHLLGVPPNGICQYVTYK